MQHLAAPVWLMLSSTPATLDLTELATIADKVVESTAPVAARHFPNWPDFFA